MNPFARVCTVSIITPVYNGAAVLGDAVASVLGQDFTDWEWIIVNDGSVDSTREILDQLADPRIKIVHQVNAGVSAARNVGLDQAQGEFVTFLDADDILPSTALRQRAELLESKPEVDIVNGAVRITSGGFDVSHYHPSRLPGPLLPRLMNLEAGVFFSVNYMVRRARIGDHRFPIGLSHAEDLIFFLTLAHDSDLQYDAVPGVVYEYRRHAGSAMSDLEGLEAGYLAFLDHVFALTRLGKQASGTRWRVASIMMKSWLKSGKPVRAKQVTLKVFRGRGRPGAAI